MNTMRIPFILGISIISFHILTSSVDVNELITKYETSQKALRQIILEDAKNKKAAENIARLQCAIRKIEKEAGITALQLNLAQLRLESCQQQQQEPVKAYLNKIKKITREIKEITAPERKQVDQLVKQQRNIQKDDPQIPVLKKQVKELQQKMRDDSQEQLDEIEDLNQKIISALSDKINAGRPIALEIKRKYTDHTQKLKSLDSEIASNVQEIEKKLNGTHKSQVRKIRATLRKLRRAIAKVDPCFAAKQSLKQSDWSDFFM